MIFLFNVTFFIKFLCSVCEDRTLFVSPLFFEDIRSEPEGTSKQGCVFKYFNLNKISKKSQKSLACVDELRIF